MSSGYKISADGLYFLTFQVVGWVDIFTRKIYREIVLKNLLYCQENKGLNLFAYVIMSNHIHLVAQSEYESLSGIIRDFKSYTGKKILEAIQDPTESRRDWMKLVFEYHGKDKNHQTYQVWTRDNHAEHVFSQKFIDQKVNYIHNNHVRAGIVSRPEDYLYSSASNYADMDSMLEVTRLDCAWKTY